MADRHTGREIAEVEEGRGADPEKVAGLMRDLDRLHTAGCAACSRRLCGHEALCSVFMGLKDAPRCMPCLAAVLGWGPEDFREHIAEHFRQRDCYTQAWHVASQREGLAATWRPACLWPEGNAAPPPALAHQAPVAALAAGGTEAPAPADEWNAGHMACGELVLALRIRLRAMPPGGVLRVTALDPAAPEDLPAWCRLTGHRLLSADHPEYLIQRKES